MFELRVYGYVVMPEHAHLLLSEPNVGTLADALKSLKQGVARRLMRELALDAGDHFWLRRYYDRNVRSHDEFVRHLRYIHRNPVKRGLCTSPEHWKWSSFQQWATGCDGRIEIECEWTALKRERGRTVKARVELRGVGYGKACDGD